MREHSRRQRARGTSSPDAAGPPGEGTASGADLLRRGGQCLYAAVYIETYNARFAKAPRDAHNAHRALRPDEALRLIFSWRELRKVTKDLTLHYERKLFLLEDIPENRRLIGKYLEVFQFPDGRVEIRIAGRAVPYSVYEKLGAIDQGAIVENKRLGHTLQVAQLVQAKRDSHAYNVPSTAHRADGTRVPRAKLVDSKAQRELGPEDLQIAITAHIANVGAAVLGASDALAGRQTALPTEPNQNKKRRTKSKAA
jgi:hypothetical protein